MTPEQENVGSGENDNIFISQPGSSVATSLCESEAVDKKVGLLSIQKKMFKMEELPLKTVRPMIFRTVNLEADGPDMSKAKNEKEAQMKIEKFLTGYIETLLREELPKKLTGHPNQPKLPLVRVRVEFEVDSHQLAVGRFGNNFHDRVANPAEMLLFKNVKRRIKTESDSVSGMSFIKSQTGSEEIDAPASIEDIIKENFAMNSDNESAMKLLSVCTRGK